MEYESDADRACGFSGRLTDEELVVLSAYGEALRKLGIETTPPGRPPDYAAASEQRSLASVSGDQALSFAHTFERLAGGFIREEKGATDWKSAAACFRLAARYSCAAVGLVHPQTVTRIHQLAVSLERGSRFSEALPLCRFVLAFYDQSPGAAHPDAGDAVMNLADCLAGLGDYESALPLRRRQLELFRAHPGHHGEMLDMSLVDLASCLFELGMYAEELPARRALLGRRSSSMADSERPVLDALHGLASCEFNNHRAQDALTLFTREVTGFAKGGRPVDLRTLQALMGRAMSLQTLGQFKEAADAFADLVVKGQAAGFGHHPLVLEADESRRAWLARPGSKSDASDRTRTRARAEPSLAALQQNMSSQPAVPPNPPFTLSEITDRLIKAYVPRAQFQSVLQQTNATGEAEFTPGDDYPYAIRRGTPVRMRLSRVPAGLAEVTQLPVARRGLTERLADGWRRVAAFASSAAIRRTVRPRGFTLRELPFAPACLAADDDVAWVGSEAQGLWRIDRATQRIDALEEPGVHPGIKCLHLSGPNLWVGTQDGLHRLNTDTDTWTHLRILGEDRGVKAITTSGSYCWVAGHRDLVQIDLANDDARAVRLPLPAYDVSALAAIDNELWVGCDAEDMPNVFVLDMPTGKWETLRPFPGGVLSMRVLPFMHSPGLYVGTVHGIHFVDRGSRDAVRPFPFKLLGGASYALVISGEYLLLATSGGLYGVYIPELIMQSDGEGAVAAFEKGLRRKVRNPGVSLEQSLLESSCIRRLTDQGAATAAAAGVSWGWAIVPWMGIHCVFLPDVLGGSQREAR